MDLDALFPGGAHRFHLTLRRGAPEEFFGRQDPSGDVLRERAAWLEQNPACYAAAQPEAGAVVDEFLATCRDWGTRCAAAAAAVPGPDGSDGTRRMAAIGRAFEPDVLLLRRGEDGDFRLVAGALCFPTGWALGEKLGRTLDGIHGVVPGLNPALAGTIRQFLERLRPGVAFLRDNWGISASPDRNQHPARGLAAPAARADLTRLWLRVEHQALVALPASSGVLFGIRIVQHRLDGLGREAAIRLAAALRDMPEDLAAYKRLSAVRADLVHRLT